MIARISILIVLMTVIPDVYIFRRYVKTRAGIRPWHLLAWWVPGAAMIAFTAAYSMIDNFAPDDITLFDAYLFCIGLLVLPKLLFALASWTGLLFRRLFRLSANWGNYVGLVLVLGWLYVLFTGTMVGPDTLRVRKVTIELDSLPAAFDGYRIVHISDLHLGSMRQEFAERVVSQIDALRPDLIAFTGDIQNMRPQELPPFVPVFSRLVARDGVYSVLGNHDYTEYVHDVTPGEKRRLERMTCQEELRMGWRLLRNEHAVIRRGSDSIVVAGAENDGRPPFPSRADLRATLRGVAPSAFVVMLQHDPSAWRRHILPDTHAQLTLSGHTHGGQISLFGFRPTQLSGREDAGMYSAEDASDGTSGKAAVPMRYLYVSTGVGGFLPFRFHMDPEIVEITLKAKRG